MQHVVALYRGGQVAEIVHPRPGKKYEWDCERAVIITWRPDIKVGDRWPPGPDPGKLFHEFLAQGKKEGEE